MTAVVDARSATHAEAEHLLHEVETLLLSAPGLARHPTWATTHVVAAPAPHVALVLSWDDGGPSGHDLGAALRALPAEVDVLVRDGGEDDPPAGSAGSPLLEPLRHHVERTGGRLVRFPGCEEARGVLSVAELVATTCVEEVTALAGTEVTDTSALVLGDFFRPTWQSGRCTLLVQQARDGLVPFEARTQRACCSEH